MNRSCLAAIAACLLVGVLLVVGTGCSSTTPLTPAQIQQDVATAQGIQQAADTANAVVQQLAQTGVINAQDAQAAALADNAIDSLVAAYIAKVQTGVDDPADIVKAVEDAAIIAVIIAAHPQAQTKVDPLTLMRLKACQGGMNTAKLISGSQVGK